MCEALCLRCHLLIRDHNKQDLFESLIEHLRLCYYRNPSDPFKAVLLTLPRPPIDFSRRRLPHHSVTIITDCGNH